MFLRTFRFLNISTVFKSTAVKNIPTVGKSTTVKFKSTKYRNWPARSPCTFSRHISFGSKSHMLLVQVVIRAAEIASAMLLPLTTAATPLSVISWKTMTTKMTTTMTMDGTSFLSSHFRLLTIWRQVLLLPHARSLFLLLHSLTDWLNLSLSLSDSTNWIFRVTFLDHPI